MKEKLSNNIFIIIKILGLFVLTYWSIFYLSGDMLEISIYCLLTSFFFGVSVTIELCRSRKKLFYIMLITEGILGVISVFLLPVHGALLLCIAILDFISSRTVSPEYYLGGYIALFIGSISSENLFTFRYIVLTTVIILFYIEEKVIISTYRNELTLSTNIESQLKGDINLADIRHKDELRKSRLSYENIMLEDRVQISQALHDKLGHSINGSIYKLEAAKVLMEDNKEESCLYVQEVIDNLRSSMDEIRAILKHERPDKKRLALLQLNSLCDECRERFGINAVLSLDDSQKPIPENIWEIILDNTYEAVTNAMKYAECSNISITIISLNEVVRCTIEDNGVGCVKITPGMGIDGMKRRIRAVKGYIDIVSDNGFKINMLLPVDTVPNNTGR